MGRQLVHLNEKALGTVLCPRCRRKQTLDFSEHKGRRQIIEVKCECGTEIDIEIEFRKVNRKKINLYGYYQKKGYRNVRGVIKVNNLSVCGVGFYIYGYHNIHIGDRITIDFVLDDCDKSRIEKEVEVVNLDIKFAGGRFTVPAYHKDKKLCFYLMGA